jgi:alkanesulfonate monooxygenase SsuD/methylene tetrahydromethanopterin reductase-like flavin-dependent oxidoreductase (luciferase family)
MLDDGVRVEQLGFDAIWLPDHFYFERSAGIETYPDCWTLLTALAMRTERVLLGTNVLAATFRHPALMAKMAGALQELSNGRVLLGLGAGNQPHEHNAFGLDFEHRIGRFKEYLPILHALLDGQTVTFQGRYFTLDAASLRTVVPSVPVWVAAGGPQMFELTARYASGWNMAGGGMDPTAIRQKYDAFASACRTTGKDPRDIDICKMTFLAIASESAAVPRMREEQAARSKVDVQTLGTRLLVGTPDTIADHIRMLTEVGVNHHIFNVAESEQWPEYQDALECIAREVLPRVKSG